MSNKIGRFEIVSEIAHSGISSVYKATDTEGGQTVALKAIRLDALGEQGPEMIKRVLEEAEACKVLNSHNIAVLHSASEVDGHLCAAMEYVQGNSIATMLARKEGFSIWDLQDIARQSCQGLDHAHIRKVIHYSLEPAKIMVQWDGIAKILSFGASGLGAFLAQSSGKAPEVLHYMSPEQLRGDPVDARSNLFSLGAIFYEMVTERKAFGGDDAAQVREAVLESHPTPVNEINGKIHPALSAVIMKALAKAPEERYQSGQELVNDLEKCKENPAKTTLGKSPAATVKAEPKAESKPPVSKPVAAAKPPAPVATPPVPVAKKSEVTAQPPLAAKAAAAGAGWGGALETVSEGNTPTSPKLDPTAQFISNCVKATVEAAAEQEARMSAATIEEPEVQTPKIAIDPMMDEGRQSAAKARSFSDINELPPLKEVYTAPEPPAAVETEPEPVPTTKPPVMKTARPQRPKIPVGDVAKKAANEIKGTPPKLFMYAIGGALALILLIVAGLTYHIHSEDTDDENGSAQSAPAATPAPAATASNPTPAVAQPAPAPQVTPEPPVEAAPAVSITPKYAKANSKKRKTLPPAAPAIIPGALSVDSAPPGAQVQIDGRDTRSATPVSLTGLAPGQHTVVISKPGYAAETRTIDVLSGSRAIISVQLGLLSATVSVSTDPAGAVVWIDGKNTGRVTPAQISVDKAGDHNFVFKKQGYLDETTTANLQIGQTSHVSATLRALGNTDDIKIGHKFGKLFGGSDTAGMGTVSIKTQPKGAQIAINNRLLDKMSPVEFYLNPGNYEVDITLSGFKSIHKVISVEKNGKVSVEESLDRE